MIQRNGKCSLYASLQADRPHVLNLHSEDSNVSQEVEAQGLWYDSPDPPVHTLKHTQAKCWTPELLLVCEIILQFRLKRVTNDETEM